MARPTKKRRAHHQAADGPYLYLAATCEKVIKEADGTLTLCRIIDKFTISAPTPSLPPGTIVFSIVVGIRSGQAKGKRLLKVCGIDPEGVQCASGSQTIKLAGGATGMNVQFDMQLQVTQTGVYWFSVTLDDQLLSKMPLVVTYQRVVASTSSRHLGGS